MTPQNNGTDTGLKLFVADVAKNVLDQIAPDESLMMDDFMDAFYRPLPEGVDTPFDQNRADSPLGIGTPDLMASLVIPLVLTIVTELIKEGVIPSVKKLGEEKRITQTAIEIYENQIGKKYEMVLSVRMKNPKKAKKVMAAVLRALQSKR